MRVQRLLITAFTAAALALAPAMVMAQEPPPPDPSSPQVPPPPPDPPPAPEEPDEPEEPDIDVDPADPDQPDVETTGEPLNQFIVSGFVGANFGGEVDEESFDFGGAFDYVRNGTFGAQFLANFSPRFDFSDRTFPVFTEEGDEPDVWVNTYMFNGIGAGSLGEEGRWKPYVSGGIGAMTLNVENVQIEDGRIVAIGENADDVLNADETRFGGNIGAGIMGFAEQVGFRGDVRYFSDLEDEDAGETDATPALFSLDNVSFWRATAGVAFRF